MVILKEVSTVFAFFIHLRTQDPNNILNFPSSLMNFMLPISGIYRNYTHYYQKEKHPRPLRNQKNCLPNLIFEHPTLFQAISVPIRITNIKLTLNSLCTHLSILYGEQDILFLPIFCSSIFSRFSCLHIDETHSHAKWMLSCRVIVPSKLDNQQQRAFITPLLISN